MISPSQRPLPDNTQHSQQTNIHAPGGIRTHDRSRRAALDLRLRPRGYWDRLSLGLKLKILDLCSLLFDGDVPGLHLLHTSSPKKASVEMAYPRNSKYKQPSMCLYWSLVGPWASLENFWLWLTARWTLIGRKALTTWRTSNTQHSAITSRPTAGIWILHEDKYVVVTICYTIRRYDAETNYRNWLK